MEDRQAGSNLFGGPPGSVWEEGLSYCKPATIHDSSTAGCYSWCARGFSNAASVCNRCKCAACSFCVKLGSPNASSLSNRTQNRQRPDAVNTHVQTIEHHSVQ